MPTYELECLQDGYRFEKIIPFEQSSSVTCPRCGGTTRRLITAPARIIINEHRQLKYGSGSEGKFIPGSETGGLDIFVPSDGAMEQQEVDYVAGMAVEKERERVKKSKGYRNANQEAISELTKLAYQTKPGKRIEILRQAIDESGLKIKVV